MEKETTELHFGQIDQKSASQDEKKDDIAIHIDSDVNSNHLNAWDLKKYQHIGNNPPGVHHEDNISSVHRSGPNYRDRDAWFQQHPQELLWYRNTPQNQRVRGGYDPPNFMNPSFDEVMIRKEFVAKVYSILSLQFLVTFCFVLAFNFKGIFIVTYFILVCVESARRSFPTNFILLALLTISQSFIAGILSSAYENIVVLYALGMTTGIFFLVTIVAKCCPIDVTGCGIVCCILSLFLCIFGTIVMIVSIFTRVPMLHLVYCGLTVVVFILFMLYDTQMVLGGKRIELSPEEYILGAIQLYVDFIQIFYSLLPL